jgi:uracil-DNA glycosylase
MAQILEKLLKRKMTLLIGQYAQRWFLKTLKKATLTETVKKLENLSSREFCFAALITA